MLLIMGLRTAQPSDIVKDNALLMAKDNVLVRIRASYQTANGLLRIGYTTSCDGYDKWRWTGVHELIFFINNEFGGIIT